MKANFRIIYIALYKIIAEVIYQYIKIENNKKRSRGSFPYLNVTVILIKRHHENKAFTDKEKFF